MMRLKERTIGFIVNFLLGVAWASVLIGAITSFLSNLSNGFFVALVFGLIGMVPGAVAVVLLEHFFTVKAHYYEAQKQTALLREIKERLQS